MGEQTMSWRDRIRDGEERPKLRLHELPEKRGRDFVGKAEAYSLFREMIEATMPKIAEGTERSR